MESLGWFHQRRLNRTQKRVPARSRLSRPGCLAKCWTCLGQLWMWPNLVGNPFMAKGLLHPCGGRGVRTSTSRSLSQHLAWSHLVSKTNGNLVCWHPTCGTTEVMQPDFLHNVTFNELCAKYVHRLNQGSS